MSATVGMWMSHIYYKECIYFDLLQKPLDFIFQNPCKHFIYHKNKGAPFPLPHQKKK